MFTNPLSNKLTCRRSIAMSKFQTESINVCSLRIIPLDSSFRIQGYGSSFWEYLVLIFFQLKHFFTMKNQSFSRLMITACWILLIVVFGVSQGTGQATDDNSFLDKSLITSGFIGAELYYDNIDQSTINIVLKKMIDCSSQEELETEEVTIHNSDMKSFHSNVKLELQSSNEIKSENNYSCLNEKSCIKELIYQANVELGMQGGGYDITWGYGFLNNAVLNLNPMSQQGFILTNHVADPWTAPMNKGGKLASKPMHELCFENENQLKLELTDEDGDYVSIRVIPASSHMAVKSIDYYQDPLVKSPKISEEKSFLTQCPPFKEVKYSESFAGIKPLGQNGSTFSKKEKTLTVQPDLPGKYLAAFEINEFRDKIKLGSHQAIIILDIGNNSFQSQNDQF
jgi:hypothetical protein